MLNVMQEMRILNACFECMHVVFTTSSLSRTVNLYFSILTSDRVGQLIVEVKSVFSLFMEYRKNCGQGESFATTGTVLPCAATCLLCESPSPKVVEASTFRSQDVL